MLAEMETTGTRLGSISMTRAAAASCSEPIPTLSPKGSVGPGVNLDLILWLSPGTPKVLQHVMRAQLRVEEVVDASSLS